MSQIQSITAELLAFRNARDWEQFHNPKDLATGLSIEASELLECFLWKKPEEADLTKVREELADVFSYALLLAHHYGINVAEIVHQKIEHNERKYPVDKAKGSAKKYTEL
jgi:NTP pyrophosphatase (non-canonical NTP hydrolase)